MPHDGKTGINRNDSGAADGNTRKPFGVPEGESRHEKGDVLALVDEYDDVKYVDLEDADTILNFFDEMPVELAVSDTVICVLHVKSDSSIITYGLNSREELFKGAESAADLMITSCRSSWPTNRFSLKPIPANS